MVYSLYLLTDRFYSNFAETKHPDIENKLLRRLSVGLTMFFYGYTRFSKNDSKYLCEGMYSIRTSKDCDLESNTS